jgi:hypothetical protein
MSTPTLKFTQTVSFNDGSGTAIKMAVTKETADVGYDYCRETQTISSSEWVALDVGSAVTTAGILVVLIRNDHATASVKVSKDEEGNQHFLSIPAGSGNIINVDGSFIPYLRGSTATIPISFFAVGKPTS